MGRLPARGPGPRFEPTSRARYVRFETLYRPEEFRGQRRRNLDYPYVEGLRMDEALNPLAILVVGLYGKTLLNQNGAPLRLMVPWKYGFKSLKSIVKIQFVEEQPRNTWNVAIPHEYGFYANVNPEVSHRGGRRPPSAGSAASSASGRRCSTATATRWPTCTKGWTWRRTTEPPAGSGGRAAGSRAGRPGDPAGPARGPARMATGSAVRRAKPSYSPPA